MTKLNNEGKFYELMRNGKLLGPVLDTQEFEGLKAILSACSEANWPLAYTSYGLATAYHETAHTLQPIHEFGGPKYFTRMYDIKGARPELARKNGNTTPGDGIKYHGRGYVQLTWKTNYATAEKICKIPGLVANPDLALTDVNAAKIMISGMQNGWFTTKACKSFLPISGAANIHQFTEARRIINGTDKALTIAQYAIDFQTALIAGDWR